VRGERVGPPKIRRQDERPFVGHAQVEVLLAGRSGRRQSENEISILDFALAPRKRVSDHRASVSHAFPAFRLRRIELDPVKRRPAYFEQQLLAGTKLAR
jgi:hypothetical protein